MSERTRAFLERAGWSASRRVDVSEFEEALVAQGYVVSPAAREFLERFGGLHVAYHTPKLPHIEDIMHIDPIRIIEPRSGRVERCQVEWYEERAGESLIPVGDVHRGHMVLMVAPSGNVYGAYGDLLWLLGGDWLEVIDDMCEGRVRKAREIP